MIDVTSFIMKSTFNREKIVSKESQRRHSRLPTGGKNICASFPNSKGEEELSFE